MKRLFAILILVIFMNACNEKETIITAKDFTEIKTDTSIPSPSTMQLSALQEGMMGMKEGKMLVLVDGNWADMDKPITCSNGCKVMPSGEVVMPDGTKMMMTEGMIIDKEGRMRDKDWKMIDIKADK